jgi:hypothetical protein
MTLFPPSGSLHGRLRFPLATPCEKPLRGLARTFQRIFVKCAGTFLLECSQTDIDPEANGHDDHQCAGKD